MSLLTDAELARAAYPALENVPSHWLTGRNRRVADAATEVALRAVAEWLGEYCDNPKHESKAKRIACIRCLWELQDAGTFGKMPGEE